MGALAESGDDGVEALLFSMSRDSDPGKGARWWGALGEMGEAAVPRCVALVKSKDALLRHSALATLLTWLMNDTFPESDLRTPLEWASKHENDRRVRKNVCGLLEKLDKGVRE